MMARAGVWWCGRGGRRGPRGPRPAPSSSRCAFCTRERRLELHFRVRSARLGARGRSGPARERGDRRGRRPCRGPRRSSRGPRRCRLSKSVAKARIAPGCRRRNVDIPRFPSRPIPARGAFATDLDTPPPRAAPRAPPVPLHARPARHRADPGPRVIAPGEKGPLHEEKGRSRGRGGVAEGKGRSRRSGERVKSPSPSLADRGLDRTHAGPRPGVGALARVGLTGGIPAGITTTLRGAPGVGLRNASPARRSQPQLAPCELSATKFGCARSARARLAQCDLR